MVAEKSSVPTFWIIAGPNGSGKSTLYGSKRDAVYGNTIIADASRPFWIINPDLLAARIRVVERLAQRAAIWRRSSASRHGCRRQSTPISRSAWRPSLSTDKYRRLVRAAKERGYEVRLIYVILQTPDLNVERVRLRVQKGGHNVPAGKVRERWGRSLDQLPWFLNQADWALLFDNSRELRVIGRKQRGVVELDPTAPADVRDAVEKIRSTR